MRAGDQIGVFDLQVIDRDHGKSAGHAHPALAVIEAEVDAGLGADEQQPWPDRIGADDAGDLGRWESRR